MHNIIFLFEMLLEGRDCLVICNVESGLMSHLLHVFEYRVKGFDDGGVGEVLDWRRVDVVFVVIPRHIVEYSFLLIDRTGSVPVVSVYKVPAFLSASAAKQKNVVYLFIL